MISQDPSSIKSTRTDWGITLDIFYENKTLCAAAAKVCVYGEMVAGVAGDKILAKGRGEHLGWECDGSRNRK
jgi:hypothetical protein